MRMNPARQTSVTLQPRSSAYERFIVCLARGVFVVRHDDDWNRGVRHATEPHRVGTARNNDRDARAKPPVPLRVNERLQVTAAPGSQHSDGGGRRSFPQVLPVGDGDQYSDS